MPLVDSIKDMFETVLKGRPKKIDILGPQLIKSLQAYVNANQFIQQEIVKVKDSLSVLTDDQKQFLMVSPKLTPFVGSDVKSVGSVGRINKFINKPVTRHGTTYGFIDEERNQMRDEEARFRTQDDTNIKIQLDHPWDVASHYYEEMAVCRQSEGSDFIRHNYFIVERNGNEFTLKCKHCDATLQHRINYENRRRFNTPNYEERIEKIKLWEAQQNLGPGDIVIYRMYWRKDASGSYLPFPGMNYEGKTEGSAVNRIYRDSKSHINSIKSFDLPIHKLIKNDFTFVLDEKSFIDHARSQIKVEVLDIVRFQGDWAHIRSIQDSELQEQAINKAKERTEEIAGKIETFFIGFYHSQFLEFGGNYEAGGARGGRGTALLPFDTVDNAIDEVLYYNRFREAKEKCMENLGLSYPNQESKLVSNLEAWYEDVRDHHFTTVLGRKQATEADKYFRLGYNMKSIARIFNQKSGQQRVTDEYISGLLKVL